MGDPSKSKKLEMPEKLFDEIQKLCYNSYAYSETFNKKKDVLTADEKIGKSVYTKKDIGAPTVQVVDVGRDGGYGEDIQKAIDKTNIEENQKRTEARNWLKRYLKQLQNKYYYELAGMSYLAYAKARKRLGVPVENPVIRFWNWKYIKPILSYVNPGGLISVKDGTYTLNSALTILKNNLILQGVGWSTIFDFPASAAFDGIVAGDAANVYSGLGLRDFQIDMVNQTGGNQNGIGTKLKFSNIQIDNVFFKNSVYRAIGIGDWSGGANTTDAKITRCRVEGSSVSEPFNIGIPWCVIAHNYFQVSGLTVGAPITVEYYAPHCTVLGNEILISPAVTTGPPASGMGIIVVTGSHFTNVIGNLVSGGASGFVCDNIINHLNIIGNIFDTIAETGLWLGDSGRELANFCIVAFNNFKNVGTKTNNTYYVIYLNTGGADGSFDNQIIGNSFETTSGNEPKNFYLEEAPSDRNIVAYNKFIAAQIVGVPIVLSGASSKKYSNEGYNPYGFAVTTPAFPASTVDVQNTTGSKVRIIMLTSGTVTAYQITDPAGAVQAVTASLIAGELFELEPLDMIQFTYTVAPTWKWYEI